MMFIGDQAQLPPIGETESPALQADVLRSYGLHVYQCTLNEVLRQSQESGILFNATDVRNLMSDGRWELPKVRFDGFTDIRNVPGGELIETLSASYSKVGLDDTIVVTRSNKRANIYNQGIRNQVLDRDDMLCRGDQLMIVKNNYHWMKAEMAQAVANGENTLAQELPMEFIANGDRAVVRKVRNVHEQYGFHFAEVTMTFPDYDDYELTATTLLDTLTSEAPALTREQQELLYNKVMEDYADIPFKADRLKKLREDRYYNALQVKFAYAATCHKAQGGQWAHVYVDQGYMTDDMLSYDYLHWLYTAFTRATERLYLVNWPETQTI
jgi:ATP-dependent exoDNAse (exonuclease V) alpha subunit